MRKRFVSCLALLAMLFTGAALAQRRVTPVSPVPPVQPSQEERSTSVPAKPGAPQNLEYVLGANDEITIMALDVEEIANKPLRISPAGDIDLTMIGRIHAAGKTVLELQSEVTERLSKFVKRPDVAISVTQFRSQPVTVLGSVGRPGQVQLEGKKTLLEVLSLAGDLRMDASSRFTLFRPKENGPIPLASAVKDSTSGNSTAEINYRSIIEGGHAELNIQILPNDVITVPRAKIVYAMGEVKRPGGFALTDRDGISLLQLLAMAEGPTQTAIKTRAKILRPKPGSEPEEVAVDLKKLMDHKMKDIMLQPEDILWVPDSYTRSTIRQTLSGMVQATTGMIIYRY